MHPLAILESVWSPTRIFPIADHLLEDLPSLFRQQMAFILALFRSKPRIDKPAKARRNGGRFSRSQPSAAPHHSQQIEPLTKLDSNLDKIQIERRSGGHSLYETKSMDSTEPFPPLVDEGPDEPATIPAVNGDHASELLSQSQRGSKRLSGLKALFRQSKASQDRESVLGTTVDNIIDQHESSNANAMETSSEKDGFVVLSENEAPAEPERDSTGEARRASSQTTRSNESSHSNITVCRHPSQRDPTSIQEIFDEGWMWPSILNYTQEIVHSPEPSDPFSDSKNVDDATEPSVTSGNRSQKASTQKSLPLENLQVALPLPSIGNDGSSRAVPSTNRTSSASSHASRTTQISHLDRNKATVAFNQLAARLNLHITIPHEANGLEAFPLNDVKSPVNEVHGVPRRRHGLLGRVRPVRSAVALATTARPSDRKLRRTKTFSSLARRSAPMSSLRGNESVSVPSAVARVHRRDDVVSTEIRSVGPPSFTSERGSLTWLLAGPNTAELFVEPGDIKAAARLYDYFASQVLLAEKDEPKIALTMRVIAMPHLETRSACTEAAPVLSVCWPSILPPAPEDPLPHMQNSLAALSPKTSAQVQLIALAITAQTSEMQCALICAVFGLLTALVHETERTVERMERQRQDGIAVPEDVVAGLPTVDGLARVFGPLLLGADGRARGSGAGVVLQSEVVEQEVEEQRVAELLILNWCNVSRQLKLWARYGYPARMRMPPPSDD
ncbi:hypothetical protein N7510_004198 [Penicillium lagena]|uniref:uncharacterized protein n=1 Tax=Penicillium lagena TaxID=94218 RepID=UPI00253F79E1|nr:uncharacterized protein N7510_004198 [Penicillium lagena]KAJ5620214.1 hypothetical protein N7510_004198 [Penicillium lagena]